MITCPNCYHQEVEGALFCTKCGAQILQPGMAGKKVKTSQVFLKEPHNLANPPQEALLSKQAPGLYINILESGKIIPLENRPDVTLGRAAEGQPILPDVDLAPYQGFEKGVSRIHLVIRQEENSYSVSDLGSVNGTQLNSQKLAPRKPYPLHHGDILSLGKMNIQVLIRK